MILIGATHTLEAAAAVSVVLNTLAIGHILTANQNVLRMQTASSKVIAAELSITITPRNTAQTLSALISCLQETIFSERKVQQVLLNLIRLKTVSKISSFCH